MRGASRRSQQKRSVELLEQHEVDRANSREKMAAMPDNEKYQGNQEALGSLINQGIGDGGRF